MIYTNLKPSMPNSHLYRQHKEHGVGERGRGRHGDLQLGECLVLLFSCAESCLYWNLSQPFKIDCSAVQLCKARFLPLNRRNTAWASVDPDAMAIYSWGNASAGDLAVPLPDTPNFEYAVSPAPCTLNEQRPQPQASERLEALGLSPPRRDRQNSALPPPRDAPRKLGSVGKS